MNTKTIEQNAGYIVLTARNSFAYNSATSLIIGASKSHESIDGKIYYYLDNNKSQVIRTDITKKTIELSDKVDEDITEGIKHILGER